jgi:hypothetical protein
MLRTVILPSLRSLILPSLTQKTAQLISSNQEQLKKVKWTDGESNTDSGFSSLACESCLEAWETVKNELSDVSEIVGLELTTKGPDVTLVFSKGNEVIHNDKIELKSGKAKQIPGSTISSCDINQYVIFCLRNDKKESFEIRYGQYHMLIKAGATDLFQDRSPRPAAVFNNLADVNTAVTYVEQEKADWVQHALDCAFRRIDNKMDSSWQDDFMRRLIQEAEERFVERTSLAEFTRLKY